MNRRYNPCSLVMTIAIAISLMLAGCSSDKGSTPTFDINAKLNEAWNSFGTGNYDGALATFSDVLSHSASNAEALMGRGWCKAFKKDYTAAIVDFNSSIGQTSTADAKMGLAAVYRDLPDFQASITNASAVIAADSQYVFTRKTSIDFKDAHLIKAQCYFRLGKSFFPSAHTEVNYLCTLLGFSRLPAANSLPATDYEKQLGQKLDDLSAAIK